MPWVFGEDPELLRAYREGRREALERVYRHYVRIVERYLRAFARTARDATLREPDAIADLLQEVFVRAFSAGARKGYDGQRDFGPYLTTIAWKIERRRYSISTNDQNSLRSD
jgi:DNA-directed RNA polymerase specialized sigma24 family protein